VACEAQRVRSMHAISTRPQCVSEDGQPLITSSTVARLRVASRYLAYRLPVPACLDRDIDPGEHKLYTTLDTYTGVQDKALVQETRTDGLRLSTKLALDMCGYMLGTRSRAALLTQRDAARHVEAMPVL
jgi:hypothetical protein